MRDDQEGTPRLESVGSRRGGGNSSGPGGRIDDITAPDDNLAGLMRNRVTIIGDATKPIGSVHIPSQEPRLLSKMVGVLPDHGDADQQKGDDIEDGTTHGA